MSTLTSLYEAEGEGPSLAGCWPETSSVLHFMVSPSKEGPGAHLERGLLLLGPGQDRPGLPPASARYLQAWSPLGEGGL